MEDDVKSFAKSALSMRVRFRLAKSGVRLVRCEPSGKQKLLSTVKGIGGRAVA